MGEDRRLSHLSDPEERIQVARLLDLAERSVHRKEVCLSAFCSPRTLLLTEAVFRGIGNIRWAMSGGYPEAERKRLVTMPDFITDEPDFALSILRMEPKGSLGGSPGHRDYLGAILGLGLVRDRIGDVLVDDTGATVVIDEALESFVLNNLREAGRSSLKVRTVRQVPEIRQDYQDMQLTLSGIRLDAVLARGFSMSRSEAEKQIRNERVKVNWKVENRPGAVLSPGDLISCQGQGRLTLLSLDGENRKAKTRLTIRKFL